MAKKKKPVIEEEIIYVSKSELKRDAQQYQQLAIDLAAMSKKILNKTMLRKISSQTSGVKSLSRFVVGGSREGSLEYQRL